MRLERIELRRMPGIEQPVRIDGLGAGINLIVGPNGSGKSSLCRAVDATLWPDARGSASDEVESIWRLGDLRLRAELASGVRWTAQDGSAAEPALPGETLRRGLLLGMRDLLDPGAREDSALAERLRVQIAGGFDLRAAAKPFDVKPQQGRKESKALAKARLDLARLQNDRRDLAEEVDARPALLRDREAAREAMRRLAALKAAEELAECRVQLATRQREMALLPPAMERLQGNELERAKQLDGERDEVERECTAARERLAEAARRREACGLPTGPVEADRLRAWLARARELEACEREVGRFEDALAEARSAFDGAASRLSGRPEADRGAALEEPDLDAVQGWLRDATDLEVERKEVERRLDALASAIDPERVMHEEERRAFDRAIQLLEQWGAARSRPNGWAWGRAAASGLLLGGLGTASVALFERAALQGPQVLEALGALLAGLPPWSGALGFGAFLGLGGFTLAAPWGRERVGIERQHAALAQASRVEGIVRWEPDEVSQQLQGLREAIRESDATCELERERDGLAQRSAGLTERDDQLARERARLCERYAVSPGAERGPLEVADLFDRLSRRRAARQQVEEAQGALAQASARRDAARTELVDAIRQLDARAEDVDPLREPGAGAAAIEAVLDDLRQRSEAWRQAESAAGAAQRELDQAERRGSRCEASLSGLLRAAGVEPDAADARRQLEDRCARRAEYLNLRDAASRFESRIEHLQAQLASDPDLADCNVSGEALASLIEACEERASRLDSLTEQIGRLDEKVEQAGKGLGLEAADAAERDARDALEERLDERLTATAGSFLLDDVEAEFEQTRRPVVLERAMELFSAFCEHRYALRLDTSADGASFRAIEVATGREHRLHELSDGTRMQLLLAARLAFPLAAERDGAEDGAAVESLPIFLDEALTASDPGRFRAVVESLSRLAQRGQQIFYLTCSDGDVAYWQQIAREGGLAEPHVVDLGELRRLDAAGSGRLLSPRLPEVPAPGDETPEAYGARLGVGVPRPHDPVAGVHLFHLLRDDLALLHRILSRARVEAVGHWQALGDGRRAACGLDDAEVARVDAWVALAQCFFEAVRIGRGRPIDLEVLEASGVTARFLAPLGEIAREVGGDAASLLQVLEEGGDSRGKGFGPGKQQALAEGLRDSGHLVDAAPLDLATLRARCLGAVASEIERGRLPREAAVRRIDAWFALVTAGSPQRAGAASGDDAEVPVRNARQAELAL